MKRFRLEIEADFIVEASGPEVVRHRLERLLLKNNFEQKNFTFGIIEIGKERGDMSQNLQTNKVVTMDNEGEDEEEDEGQVRSL